MTGDENLRSRGGPLIPTLVLLASNGDRLKLSGARIRVGRESALELHLDDPSVSRRHAELNFDPAGGWTVTDCSSTNGTYHRGAQIDQAALSAGDEIRFGDLLFVVESALGPLESSESASEASLAFSPTVVVDVGLEGAGTHKARTDQTYLIAEPRPRLPRIWLQDVTHVELAMPLAPLAESLLPFAHPLTSPPPAPPPDVGRRATTESVAPDGPARRLDTLRSIALGVAILLLWPLIFFHVSAAGLESQTNAPPAPSSLLSVAESNLGAFKHLRALMAQLPLENGSLVLCNSGSRPMHLKRVWAIWVKNLSSKDPQQQLGASSTACRELVGKGVEIPAGGQLTTLLTEQLQGCLGPDGAVAVAIEVLDPGNSPLYGLVVPSAGACFDVAELLPQAHPQK